jgi:hypothetical protein
LAVVDDGGTEAAAPAASVEGLYPLWEQTGSLDAPGAARVGWGHAAVGLGPVALSTQPFLDIYGTANLSAKVRLYRGTRVDAALVVGGYRIPSAAESSGIGSLDMSTFADPFAPVWLLPVSAAVTALLTPRLHLHLTATMLTARSPEASYQSLTGGVAGFCEWFASPTWSARVHAGSEGWPTTPQTHAGLSFALHTKHVALSAGYARRFDPGGTTDNVFLWDAGLLFP